MGKERTQPATSATVLRWTGEQAAESLAALCLELEGAAGEFIDWYDRKGKPRKVASNFLRTAAVLFAVVGSICPLLGTVGRFDVVRVGYVLFAFAAGVVILDQALGISSGWTRFMLAELELRRALVLFRIEWAGLDAARGRHGNVSELNPEPYLKVLHAFGGLIYDIVERETGAWSGELRQNLERLKRFAKERDVHS